MSRFNSALATAAPSVAANGGGLARNRRDRHLRPTSRTFRSAAGGRSSAKGCGKGWQAGDERGQGETRQPADRSAHRS